MKVFIVKLLFLLLTGRVFTLPRMVCCEIPAFTPLLSDCQQENSY
jgi:hypothetical protein